jgi:S-adenosylmethionine:tRNA ribosyltransferase-isomerase
MQLSGFDYHLPEDLIAQEPLPQRDAARMLVVHREEQSFEDRNFREFPEFLCEGDCVVLNDSRVLPSRLFSGKSEMLLLEPISEDAREWRALVRPGRKLQPGVIIRFDETFAAEIIARGERGERTVRFSGKGDNDVYAAIERLGHMPLPPYIKRQDRPEDRDRYQTVFARERGSAAAPTAGLHFTAEILDRIPHIAHVTLHVGLGTFQPLDREDFQNHQLHHERYSISEESAREIESAKRVVAVGTTSVRTLESWAATGRRAGSTNLFIYPGYRFRRTGAMLTNFHLPRTSLLLLVCAFAGTDLALAAYRYAVEQRYRFFSYGDCMLIL